jgi:hypothetical protein
LHTREVARQVDEIELDEPGPYLAARVALARGSLAMFEGRFDEARQFAARGIDGYQALGMRMGVAIGKAQELAQIEVADGNLAGARSHLLEADAVAATLGERSYRATLQATLADVYALLDDRAAARAAIELSDELSARQDVINYTITHSVRARLALVDRDSDAAERWARSAVGYAFLTDFPQAQATAKLVLARILASTGRANDSITEARAALKIFAAKGDRVGSDEARKVLDELDKRGWIHSNEVTRFGFRVC